MLQIEDLHISFDTFEGESRVIRGVYLTVAEGETVAVVGETGCGKSVTMKAILGILPTPPARIIAGKISFRGQNLLELDPHEWQKLRGKKIALIPQDPMTSLNPVFTVGEQLMDAARWQGRLRLGVWEYLRQRFRRAENAQIRARLIDMLEQVRIPDPARVLKSYPIELSGGMRQRILIALALIGNPDLLIADEPGTALDVTTQDQIIRLLKERITSQRVSVLYVTHNLGVARQISQRICVMYAGEIVESARTEVLFRSPTHPYTRGLLRSIPKLTGEKFTGMDGRIPDYTNPPTGCRFHPRCPYKSARCEQEVPLPREVEGGNVVACHHPVVGEERGEWEVVSGR